MLRELSSVRLRPSENRNFLSVPILLACSIAENVLTGARSYISKHGSRNSMQWNVKNIIK